MVDDEPLFTFVFTDIEGSTALLQRFGIQYEELLAAHHRLVRAEVERHGGFEIGTEGDAFFLGFSDNHTALAMCVSAQVALNQHPWPPGGTVRIRMGVHRGHARVAESGWIGLGLHSAARVASTAHGGQVVMSETATSGELPNGVGVLELGTFALKDIGPIRLSQLAHPQLRASFPALRARLPAVSRLPAPVSSFVGREDAVTRIGELLHAHRLVTLVGTGGCGKTRLALQAVADRHFDDIDLRTLVDLATASEDDGVLDELGRATAAPARASLAELVTHIGDRNIVLVLDGCEHVVEAVTRVIPVLLQGCSALRILATSRQPLGLGGEQVMEVGAMQVDDAAALLRLRINEAGGTSADVSDAAVHELVASLDALPLALELVAPRMRGMTVEELSRRVTAEGPLRAASQGRGRRRSLADEIRWSYDLLTADEQTAFARLSVLVGDASYAHAEAVVAGDDTTIDFPDAIEGLVAKSLVHRASESGTSRYRMLDTVRAFAIGCLAERDGDTLRFERRYVEVVTSWLEAVHSMARGAAPEHAAAVLERDRHHIHAALARADCADPETALRLVAAHSDFMNCGTDPAQLETVFAAALHPVAPAPEPLIAAAEVALARYAGELGRDDISERHAALAVERTRRDAPQLLASALVARAALEDDDEHRSTLHHATEAARATDDLWSELDAVQMLAFDNARRGDLDRTEELLADVYGRAGRAGYRLLQDYAIGSLLSLNHVLGRHTEARHYRDEGLPRWRSLGGRDLVSHLFLAAALAADEGETALVEQYADEAQLVASEHDEEQQADAAVIRALALAATEGPEAEGALRSALELPGEDHWMPRFRARLVLGEHQLARGDIAVARQNFITALNTPGCLSPDLYVRALENLAAVCVARDEVVDAVRRCGVARGERRRTRCPVQPARREFVATLERRCHAAIGTRFAELLTSGEAVSLAAEISAVPVESNDRP